MSRGYDLLIQAQCSESMNSLDFNGKLISEIIENEERLDVKSRLCERIAFLIYQDSNFGLIPHNSPDVLKILSCISGLCKSFRSPCFPTEPETFVGLCPSSSHSTAPNCSNHFKERILCATLLSSPVEELPAILESSFSSEYPSTASLAQKLLDNDERFLTSMLALLPLMDSLKSSSIFHPVSVFLEAMHLISYDCDVLIDWLNSELAASSLILRVLKSNCNEKSRKYWTSYAPKKIPYSSTSTVWKDVPVRMKQNESAQIVLKIIEIVGDQEMTKTLNVGGVETLRIAHKETTVLRNSGDFEKWLEMVAELNQRLRRLLASNLVVKKFDLILKWCDKLSDEFKK